MTIPWVNWSRGFAWTATLIAIGIAGLALGSRGRSRAARAPAAAPGAVGDRTPASFAIRPWAAARRNPDEVARALAKAEPYFQYRRVPDLLHLLELWGPDAAFPDVAPFPTPFDAAPVSGRDALAFLLQGEGFEKYYSHKDLENWLLTRTPHGVREQVGDLPSLSPHVDNLLAVCAEGGLPLSTPIRTKGGEASLAVLLADSLARFEPGQEIEFTAVALARYLPPERSWTDRFGRPHSLDEVVDALLATPAGQGVCAGTHVPISLATLHRIGEERGVLSASKLARIEERLRGLTRLLEHAQADDGSWDDHWAGSPTEAESGNPDITKIHITSHHIQWMCLGPESCRVSDAEAERATRFLVRAMTSLDDATLPESRFYTSISHGAHALVLPHGCSNAWLFRRRLLREARENARP